MTFIQEILDTHTDAINWQQQYPWFAMGHLVAANKLKETPQFEAAAQQVAVFINDIPRLHWLLHQPEWSKENLIPLMAGKQETPVPLTDTASLSAVTENQPTFNIDLSGPPNEEETMDEEAETTLPQPSFSSTLKEAASNLKTENATDDSLLFETAYQHTIDYFASQGIRLEDEPAHDDRFGQQLKTFTSWLRQMKRLPNTPEQDADASVETYAAHSLQKGDVLTESMVDILLKQGKKQQALQVLEKLRLLHPEKSLYFATRSEQIKHSK